MTAIDPSGQSTADQAASQGLVARVRGAAAAELARRLGPARLFTPSEDDQALVWSVIAEQLADAHREHVLAGGVPLDDRASQRLAQQVFDALLGRHCCIWRPLKPASSTTVPERHRRWRG